MKIYRYSRGTHEFLGEAEARFDPVAEHRYLIPAYATKVKPPPSVQNKIQRFNTETSAWWLDEDHRGHTVWNKLISKSFIVETIGAIANEYTFSDPIGIINPVWGIDWGSDKWVRVWKKSDGSPGLPENMSGNPADYTLLDPAGLVFPLWDGTGWIEDQDKITEQERQDDISNAQNTSSLKQITIAQANAYINAQLDTVALDATGADVQNAADLAELKAATYASLLEMRSLIIKIREVDLAIVPHILK